MAKYVRAEEMATMLEVDVRAVEMLVENGMPEVASGKFDPNEAVPWYLAYMRTKIFGKAKLLGVILR
jgi:phage terminase Nu1 subunit (DNA packaging protein)